MRRGRARQAQPSGQYAHARHAQTTSSLHLHHRHNNDDDDHEQDQIRPPELGAVAEAAAPAGLLRDVLRLGDGRLIDVTHGGGGSGTSRGNGWVVCGIRAEGVVLEVWCVCCRYRFSSHWNECRDRARRRRTGMHKRRAEGGCDEAGAGSRTYKAKWPEEQARPSQWSQWMRREMMGWFNRPWSSRPS